MSDDALSNSGERYRDRVFVVDSVSTKYMPAKEFFDKGKPAGYHPGWHPGWDKPQHYDLQGFGSSLYEWELEPAPARAGRAHRAAGAMRRRAG